MDRDLHKENFLDKKKAKKNKDPDSNIVSHGKLEKGETQMREVDEGGEVNRNQPTVCLETLRK